MIRFLPLRPTPIDFLVYRPKILIICDENATQFGGFRQMHSVIFLAEQTYIRSENHSNSVFAQPHYYMLVNILIQIVTNPIPVWDRPDWK